MKANDSIVKTTILVANLLATVLPSLSQEPYQPTWESLSTHKMPAWYEDAKIGLSMHWGVYSVPAWAPREGTISYAEWLLGICFLLLGICFLREAPERANGSGRPACRSLG